MSDRRTRRTLSAGLRPLLPLAVLWLAGSLLLYLLIRQEAVPHEQLLLDPNSYSRLPWYAGMVSNFGILGWTTGAVAAAGGAWISRLGSRSTAAELLRGGSLLSALLLLDDLFQLHVVVTKALSMPKVAFYGVYIGLGAWWALSNRAEVMRTRWQLLVAAGAALAGSAIADQIAPRTGNGLVIEDSLKFLGILAWAQFYVITGRDITRSIIKPGSSGSTPSGDFSQDQRPMAERPMSHRALPR